MVLLLQKDHLSQFILPIILRDKIFKLSNFVFASLNWTKQIVHNIKTKSVKNKKRHLSKYIEGDK